MGKRMILTILALAVVFGGVFGYRLFTNHMIHQYLSHQKTPPVAVAVVKAAETEWQPELKSVGSLTARQGVDVTGEIPGLVTAIHFRSGQRVQAGDVLVTLDSRAEKAQLARLEAAAELARIQMKRQKELVKKKMAPQSALDQASAQYKQIEAQIHGQTVLIDQKSIKAPFSGLLGIRQVDLGTYFAPGTPIVTLQALDPIYVDFTLPQQDFKDIKDGQPVDISVDAWPGSNFEGHISAINPKVDSESRNFKIRAKIKNADMKLRPGMFCQVTVKLAGEEKHITLPQTAISYNPYGDIIYVVQTASEKTKGKPVLKVQRRFVVTGESRGDQVAVLKGVKAGDRVVVAGQQKLKEGSVVVINNKVMPDDNPSPDLPNQ